MRGRGGAVLNGIINGAIASPGYGLMIGFGVLLGGLTTSVIVVVWAEHALRDVLAHALEFGVPSEPVGPGVAQRILLAWALASGVPLLAVALVAIARLAGAEISGQRLCRDRPLPRRARPGHWPAGPVRSPRARWPSPYARCVPRWPTWSAAISTRACPSTTSDEVGLVAQAFNRMVEGLAEREQIRDALGTYVDPDVAEHILDEGDLLEGEEVDVTVMFLDVRDFTGVRAAGDGRRRRRHAQPPVRAGRADHLRARRPRGQVHRRRPARGLRRAPAASRPRRPRAHGRPGDRPAVQRDFAGELAVGIGLNSGPVIAGNIGGGGRLEFSVIGDAVNIAARVEQATRETGDTVLVTDATCALLQADHGGFDERPPVALKGK